MSDKKNLTPEEISILQQNLEEEAEAKKDNLSRTLKDIIKFVENFVDAILNEWKKSFTPKRRKELIERLLNDVLDIFDL